MLQVDVCKLLPKFPRPMSACVRECFLRMAALDPELRIRLAGWLAMHLSNFDFMWPWERWRHVLEAPSHDAQRCLPSSQPWHTGSGSLDIQQQQTFRDTVTLCLPSLSLYAIKHDCVL